jgi:predicted  nucleic acid-binding Zn ribbon protein
MEVYQIRLDTSHRGFDQASAFGGALERAFDVYLSHLSSANLIIEAPSIFLREGNEIVTSVICPELSCLSFQKNHYVNTSLDALKTLIKCDLKFVHQGRCLPDQHYKVPENPKFLVLKHGSFSPILCGDTNAPVPLYVLPGTTDSGRAHDDIRHWNRTYENFYGLWFGSGFAEAAALHQLQEHDSELSLLGRELCAHIEKVSGLPTYYFLMNDRSWSFERDLARKCPVSGHDWYVGGNTPHVQYVFRSDAARLVSELSPSCLKP